MPVDGPLYPVNLLLDDRPCLVVGGGTVAVGKVKGLLDAGAQVTVVAPDIDPAIEAMEAVGMTIERRPYRSGEVAGYRFVIAATGDAEVNRVVYEDGEAAGVLVNAADDPAHCSATLPARVRRGDLLVTVSTGGRSPAMASWLRRRLEAQIGPEYEALLGVLAEARGDASLVNGVGAESWHRALDSGMLELIRDGRIEDARRLLRTCLSSSSD